jgi:hypothetical protein
MKHRWEKVLLIRQNDFVFGHPIGASQVNAAFRD